MARPTLYDQHGHAIDLSRLRKEEAMPTVGGVRQSRPEHPSWGLTPERLGGLMRNSETVDPREFFALAADIEERELHYRGVLGQRKAAVAQLPITVEPFDESADAKKHADLVRQIVDDPIFRLALMDVLDALGKGASWSEIVWDTSEAQWMPSAYKWRDPTWFRFDQADLTTPLLLNDGGLGEPLKPYGWIYHRPMLLSGIPIRGGLARPAAWAWMFKNFSLQAWAIFLEVFGHPLRLGRYPSSATDREKRALLSAVTNLGSDAAAIIPEGMKIEFIEAGSSGSAGSPFKDKATYLDEQISKVVVGQTGTTDAAKGGYAVGRVHNAVREDIERWDGIVLSATINRDLVRPAVDLNFGPQKHYPRVVIGRPEAKDLKMIINAIGDLVDRGLEVEQSQIYDLLGIEEPQKGAKLLQKRAPAVKPGGRPGGPPASGVSEDRADPDADAGEPSSGDVDILTSLLAVGAGEPDWADRTVEAIVAEEGWSPDLGELEAALAACTTAEEAERVLADHLDRIGLDRLAELLARARFMARGTGVTDT